MFVRPLSRHVLKRCATEWAKLAIGAGNFLLALVTDSVLLTQTSPPYYSVIFTLNNPHNTLKVYHFGFLEGL